MVQEHEGRSTYNDPHQFQLQLHEDGHEKEEEEENKEDEPTPRKAKQTKGKLGFSRVDLLLDNC